MLIIYIQRKNMFKKIKTYVAVSLFALVSACGGGGGGESAVNTPVASTESFPLITILNNMLQSGSSTFTVSGTSGGSVVTGSGNATRGSLSAGTFEAAAAQQRTTTITGSFTVNGSSFSLNGSTVSWVDSNNIPLGETGGADYVVVTGIPTIPTTVRVNDTGSLYVADRYTNSTKSVKRGTLTITYVVEADTATTALLTLIRTEKDNQSVTTTTNAGQFRITPAGSLTRVKETGLTGDTSIVITY
jgi:hypothetical protein